MAHKNSLTMHSDPQHINLFASNIKKEMDTFWNNILNEFNTFSNEISLKLEEQIDLSKSIKTDSPNTQDPNSREFQYSLTINDGDDDDNNEHKEEYKKFAKGGNKISIGHGRSLSTMEIPNSLKLEPFCFYKLYTRIPYNEY